MVLEVMKVCLFQFINKKYIIIWREIIGLYIRIYTFVNSTPIIDQQRIDKMEKAIEPNEVKIFGY
ncbi:hypothetical protein CAPN008_17840 [Capnocytophaga canis]|nr:hypothetical protein CAPN008_17840 [Capnocytophaga canis]